MNPGRTQLGAARHGLVLTIATVLGCTLAPQGVAGVTPPSCHGHAATVVGTPGNDLFERPDVDGGEVFVLLGGNDRVEDDAKNVIVCGGSGSDDITGQGPPFACSAGGAATSSARAKGMTRSEEVPDPISRGG